MSLELNALVKVTRVMNAVAVGTTTQTSSEVDMAGFDGVRFILLFGTITDGTPSIKAQQDVVTGMAGAADLAGSSVVAAATDDNKALVLDIKNPLERFLRVVVTRGGVTGCVLDGIIAEQYGATKAPIAHDASVALSETWGSPAEGTA